nr:hypothetical protein [Aulosira sp. ZfuVER01]
MSLTILGKEFIITIKLIYLNPSPKITIFWAIFIEFFLTFNISGQQPNLSNMVKTSEGAIVTQESLKKVQGTAIGEPSPTSSNPSPASSNPSPGSSNSLPEKKIYRYHWRW